MVGRDRLRTRRLFRVENDEAETSPHVSFEFTPERRAMFRASTRGIGAGPCPITCCRAPMLSINLRWVSSPNPVRECARVKRRRRYLLKTESEFWLHLSWGTILRGMGSKHAPILNSSH